MNPKNDDELQSSIVEDSNELSYDQSEYTDNSYYQNPKSPQNKIMKLRSTMNKDNTVPKAIEGPTPTFKDVESDEEFDFS